MARSELSAPRRPIERGAARVAGAAESQPGFWRRLKQQPPALVGAALSAMLVLVALFAGAIAPYDPFAMTSEVLQPPSARHLFGTDDLGRDIFSGVVHGARTSLLVGFAAAGTATVIGLLVGSLAGYAGGLIDDLLMRVSELFQIIPRFFLALIIVALLGSNIWLIVLLLGVTYWPGTARLVRAQLLSLRTRDYVTAARAIGVPDGQILIRHLLPAALPPVITLAALQVGGAILVEAGLSFLGLGDRSVVSWGMLLNDAQQFVRRAWWMSVFPGAAITLTVLGLNLLADGLNEALSPR
ncbi:MAG TPA: ABC transporter permease [Chloroflexaceae bacterium]|nr:ABC transporter permease [Chloroflexaceae bacterium]